MTSPEEVGEAYVRIEPDTSGFASSLRNQVGQAMSGLRADAQATASAVSSSFVAASAKSTDAFENFTATARASLKQLAAETAAAQRQVAQEASAAARQAASATAAAQREASRAAAQATREAAATARAAARQQELEARANAVRVSDASRIALSMYQADVARSEAVTARLTSALGGVRDGLSSLSSRALSEIAQNAQYAALAVGGLGAALIKVGLDQANQIQQANASFQAFAAQLQGGANAVDKLTQAQRESIATDFVSQIQAIARETPLAQSSLIKDTQALVSLGAFNGAQAINALKTIGNALADVGQSGTQLNQNLDGIVIAFSQISGAGRLLAQDLNQITTRIPAASRALIFEQIGKNLGLVNDIASATPAKLKEVRTQVLKLQQAGAIPSEVAIPSILQVFQNLPGAVEGGQAAALKRATTKTLSGAFEAIKDTFKQDIGKAFQDTGNQLIPALLKLQDTIGPIIDRVAKPLAALFTSLVDVILNNKDQIAAGLGSIFHALDTAITKLGPHIPDFAKAVSTIGHALADLGGSPQALAAAGVVTALINPVAGLTLVLAAFAKSPDAVGHLNHALVDLKPVIDPLKDILGSVGQVVLSLGPLFEGLAGSVAVLAPVLQVAATALGGVATATSDILNSKFGEFAGILISVGGLSFLALTALPATIDTISIAVASLAASISDLELTAAPLEALVAGIVAIGVASVVAYQQFEAFRNFVNPALDVMAIAASATANGIKDAFTGAFQGIAEISLDTARAVLQSFELILKGLSFIPKWLGGGAFDTGLAAVQGIIKNIDDVQAHVDNLASTVHNANLDLRVGVGDSPTIIQQLKDQIDSLPDRTVKEIVFKFNVIGEQNAAVLGGALNSKFNAGAKTGLEDASGFSTEGILNSFAKVGETAQDTAFRLQKIASDSTAASDTAAKSAADSAQKIQDSANRAAATKLNALAAALRRIATDTATFVKKISDKSADQIRTGFDKIVADLREQGATKLITNIRKVEDRLISLANKRKTLNDQLTAATTKLSDLKSESASFQKSIYDAIQSLGDVSNPTRGIAQTFLGISNTLTHAIGQTRRFAQNIEALREAGLNQTSLKELIDKGPAEGGDAASILARSGSAGVAQINDLEAQLTSAASSFSKSANDTIFSAGILAANSTVAALTAQEKALDKQMQSLADTLAASLKKHLNLSAAIAEGLAKGLEAAIDSQTEKIADKMVKSLRKKLKISSPSKLLFDEVGVPSGHGIISGLVSTLDSAATGSSVRSYASSVTFGPGSVVAHGATEASAQRMGTGLGMGISDVLERQLAAAIVNGHA